MTAVWHAVLYVSFWANILTRSNTRRDQNAAISAFKLGCSNGLIGVISVADFLAQTQASEMASVRAAIELAGA
jgi:hypothetical protein